MRDSAGTLQSISMQEDPETGASRPKSFLESRAYRVTEVFTSLFLLNLAWLMLCIPLVTAFPATAAMFGVVREWVRNGGDVDSGWFASFIKHLGANFFQSLGIGFLWTLVGASLLLDYVLVLQVRGSIVLLLLASLGLVTLSYLLASIYLFPLMVNYQLSWWNLVRNSFLIAISQLGTTALCLPVVGLAAVVVFYLPVTILLVGSVTAYLLYFLCQRAFLRIEAQKERSKHIPGR